MNRTIYRSMKYLFSGGRRFLAVPSLVWLFSGAVFCSNESGGKAAAGGGVPHPSERIVSLSPSITETLYALGLEDKVAGVTNFCKYPPQAQEKQQVGGYLDPNYEAILLLKPDLVILLPEQDEVRSFLTELHVRHLTVTNKTVNDILDCIGIIGDSCGAREKAAELVKGIRERIRRISERTRAKARSVVLLSIGRTMGSGTIREVYVAGGGTFYDELIGMAGGVNAYKEKSPAYPMLSAEGVLALNPDVIIDLAPDPGSNGFKRKKILREWEAVGAADAIKNERVYVLTADYAVIPGPRFINLLEDLACIIHPELFGARQ